METRKSIPAFRADSFRPDRAWKSGATFMKLGRAPATSIIDSCFINPPAPAS